MVSTVNLERRPLTSADFRKVAPNGFGDPANAYAHSMAWFRNHLFVGTTRANLANRALQIAKNTPERMATGTWPVPIPKTYWENDLRAEIWRLEPRSGAWSKVYTAPLVTGKDGFEVPLSVGFRSMTVHQGRSDSAPALYVPTWASHQTPTSLMLRSEDGAEFRVVSEPGAAVPENKPRSIRGALSFNRYLVVSPVVGQARFEPNIAGRTVLLASDDPGCGTWMPACEPGFGDPNNVSAFQMAIFNGHLYAGTLNIHEGFQIWKTSGEGPPPFKWTKVLGQGAGRRQFNQIPMTMCAFGDALYVGSGIQNCSFDYDYNVGPAPPEIIRIYPDDTWDLVIGEPRITDAGLKVPLSGLGPGFENPFAGYLWSMSVHDGWLYAGTGVWAVFLRYRDLPDTVPEQVRNLLPWKQTGAEGLLEKLLETFGGFDLWRTRDGANWVPVTPNGFDNCYNIGVRTQVSTPHGLFIGTANPFGPRVAVRRLAGWKYEENAAGGLEIWQGQVQHRWPQTEPPLPLRVVALDGNPLDLKTAKEAPQRNAAAVGEAFFNRTPWRALGYWRSGIREAPAACENLMAELLAFLPPAPGRILDVCGGNDGVLDFLLERFSSADVAAVIDDRSLRGRALKRAAKVSVLKRRQLARRSLTAAFDCTVWVDGLRPRPVSLVKLLRQSASALKPGGTLVSFETLRRRRRSPWPALRGNCYASSVQELRRNVHEAGLLEPTIVEVTTACLTAFRENLSRLVTLRACTGEAPELSIESVESQLCGRSHEIVACVFVVATKRGDAMQHRQDSQPRGER